MGYKYASIRHIIHDMSILLRICRSEGTHEMEKDSDELQKLKCDNQHFHSCYLRHLCYNEKYVSIKKNFE